MDLIYTYVYIMISYKTQRAKPFSPSHWPRASKPFRACRNSGGVSIASEILLQTRSRSHQKPSKGQPNSEKAFNPQTKQLPSFYNSLIPKPIAHSLSCTLTLFFFSPIWFYFRHFNTKCFGHACTVFGSQLEGHSVKSPSR